MWFVLALVALFGSYSMTNESLHGAAQSRFNVTTVKKAGSTQYFATKPWDGLFSAKKFDRNDAPELKNIKQTLQAAMVDLPTSHTKALEKLEVRKNRHASRGLANSKIIILNTESISSDDELQAVFTHEMGHVVDLGALKPLGWQKSVFWTPGTQVFTGDPSLDYYRLSWTDAKTRKPSAKRADFISGYAMYSPFEDFAEAYLFYRLHGEKFRQIAADSDVLAKKYAFMKDTVFKGKEFQTVKTEKGFIHNVLWDATLVSL